MPDEQAKNVDTQMTFKDTIGVRSKTNVAKIG